MRRTLVLGCLGCAVAVACGGKVVTEGGAGGVSGRPSTGPAGTAGGTSAPIPTTHMVTLAEVPSPIALAVGAGYVYWVGADDTNTRIVLGKVSVDGGPSEIVASTPMLMGPVGGVAVDVQDVFWTDGTSVSKMSHGGGAITTIATASMDSLGVAIATASIAVNATTVCWANSPAFDWQTLMVAPLVGAPVTVIVRVNSGQGQLHRIAVDSENVYWADPVTELVQKSSLYAGSGSVLSSLQVGLGAIAVDSSLVYWTTESAVVRSSKTEGPATVIASAQSPSAVAVDDRNVYFTNTGSGTVVKLPKWNGAPLVLASGQTPNAIALDDQSVYWTNTSASTGTNVGSIMKLTPK